MSVKIRKIINWCLLAVSIGLVVSGYGMVEFKVVGRFFGGLLEKSDFFKIHAFLALPFVVLMVAHVVRMRLRK